MGEGEIACSASVYDNNMRVVDPLKQPAAWKLLTGQVRFVRAIENCQLMTSPIDI